MLFSSRPKDELILIFDVQSSVVCCSLVLTKSGAAPEVLFTLDQDIPYKKGARSSYLIKMVLRAISEIIESVLRFKSLRSSGTDALGPITAVHYVLSSPWAISQGRMLSSSFAEDAEMTHAKMMGILSEERKRFLPETSEQIQIIEEKIFDVRINGYSVASWEGKKARQIEISYVTSIAGSGMIQRFQAACAHIVPENKVFFHSSLLLQHVGIRHRLPNLSSYTLVHIHGELTDVVVVEHNSCVFFGSYPLGIRGIIRKVAHGTKTDDQAADSLISLYCQKSLDPGQKKSLEILEGVSAGWMGEFQKLLEQASFTKNLPDETLLSARFHEDYFKGILVAHYPQMRIESLVEQKLAGQITSDPKTQPWPSIGLFVTAIHNMLDA